MNPLTQTNRLFAPLFADPEVAKVFSTERLCAHFLAYEIALTKGLGTSGSVDAALAQAATDAMKGFEADLGAIEAAAPVDGMAVPEFARQLKRHVGPELSPAVHIGGTSQDLIDTAMVLCLRDANTVLAGRMEAVCGTLDRLITEHGENKMMGRTRMQAALPITVRHRLMSWHRPLEAHRARLDDLRPALEVLQFGGATGDRSANGEFATKIGTVMAQHLDLCDPGYAWHTDRTLFADYAGWLARVAGSLGKIGQDICLMAQQGIDEVKQSGGGSSSAMAHKQNPVTAELLVSLAQFNAGQLPLMHQSMIHEQERSGAAWSLEWMVLPAMVCTTGKALALAEAQLNAITHIGT
ncbi:MAG: 3-carboxy-cis,cis-muconate cycloisomerase [Pseudomonadota bacterium]